jgi:hypothetical protein
VNPLGFLPFEIPPSPMVVSCANTLEKLLHVISLNKMMGVNPRVKCTVVKKAMNRMAI